MLVTYLIIIPLLIFAIIWLIIDRMDLKNDIEYLEKEVEEYKNPKYESKQCLVLYDAVHGKELQLYNSENIIEYCDGLLLIKSKEDGQTLFQGDLDQFVVFTSKRKLKKT